MAVAAQRALVIGLGKQEDKCWAKIHGDQDVALVVQMLTNAGFSDIRTVVNEQAKKKGMEAAFMGLVNRCQRGDVVYIHYSGHGQYMTDLDGDEAERWTGRHAQYDEAWVPYDAYMTRCDKDQGDKHFCDDEVAYYLTLLRQKIGSNGQLYVVIDACHSGDATRGDDEECIRGVDSPFEIPRPVSIVENAKPCPEQWLTISACKPYQLCFEMKEPKVGKLTFAVSLFGDRLFTASKEEIQEYLNFFMENNPSRVTQTPMVSGQK